MKKQQYLLITSFVSGIIFSFVIFWITGYNIKFENQYFSHCPKWVVTSTSPTPYNSDYMILTIERTFNGEIEEKTIEVKINKLIREDPYKGKFYDTTIKYNIGDTINIP